MRSTASTERRHALRIYRVATHGFVSHEASGAFGMPESVDERDRLMDLLDAALTNSATRR